MFVEQSTQEFGVQLLLTADLPNAVQRAECTRISSSTEHHHLIRVDLHRHVLQDKTDTSVILY